MATVKEILTNLAKPVHSNMMASKKLQGNTITYIPWYNLADLLDQYAPGWDYRVEHSAHPHHWIQVKTKNNKQIETERHGLMLVCKASITIYGEDGSVTREALGYQDPEQAYIGDEATNAEAAALRRACGKLGLGRDLWRKDAKPRQNGRQNNKPAQQRKEESLTESQMLELLRTALDSGLEQGPLALEKAITAANKRLSKFSAKKRAEVQKMIASYRQNLAELQATNQY